MSLRHTGNQPRRTAGWSGSLSRRRCLRLLGSTGATWSATQEILEHYDTILKRHPVDAHRTVLAGFSQGGRTAIWLTLSGILPARGFLGIACALPDEEIQGLLRDREPKHRGFLVVGTKDYVYEQTVGMADLLRSYLMPVEVETIEGLAHEIPDGFDLRLPRILDFLLS